MLNYSIQYNIANGIFQCFNKVNKKRLLSVSDKQDKLDKDKTLFPYQKYESYIKADFIVTCLYLMMKHKPTSKHKLYELLREDNFNEVMIFKNEIKSYKHFVQVDVDYLIEIYGNATPNQIITEYKKGKIKFYTVFFLFKIKGVDFVEYILAHRINGVHLQYINQAMLYITFSEVAYEYVNKILTQSNLLN
jgi:hypothetical protein